MGARGENDAFRLIFVIFFRRSAIELGQGNLGDLLHDRRMTLTELAERVGLTIANLSILKTNKARAIRFSTLEAICKALECQPGDLLHYSPED